MQIYIDIAFAIFHKQKGVAMIESFKDVRPSTPAVFPPIQVREPQFHALNSAATREERLPFTVRLVRNEADLRKAVAIRHSAYARHVPEFAEKLKAPEASDYEDGVVVLLAESKLDGSPLGTMRIQCNTYKPLSLEQSVQLPDWLQGRSLAEATRLGITDDRAGRLVKTMLFKVFYQYCLLQEIEWMVIAGRSPIDRQYERLLFKDVYPGMGYIPLRHANNMPHRVMAFHVDSAQARWAEAHHPLLDFMCHIHHPDIDLGETTVPFMPVWQPGQARTGTYN
jgi:hypothetical protein